MKWVVVLAVVCLLWLWGLSCPDIGKLLKGFGETLTVLSVDMYLSLCNLFAGISDPHEDRCAENAEPLSERHRTHVRIIKINISRLFNFANIFNVTVTVNSNKDREEHSRSLSLMAARLDSIEEYLRHRDESGCCEEGFRRACVRRRRPTDSEGGRGGR